MTPDAVLNLLRTVLDGFLAFFPKDLIRDELDAAAIRRANTIADAAEVAKFHGDPFGKPDP